MVNIVCDVPRIIANQAHHYILQPRKTEIQHTGNSNPNPHKTSMELYNRTEQCLVTGPELLPSSMVTEENLKLAYGKQLSRKVAVSQLIGNGELSELGSIVSLGELTFNNELHYRTMMVTDFKLALEMYTATRKRAVCVCIAPEVKINRTFSEKSDERRCALDIFGVMAVERPYMVKHAVVVPLWVAVNKSTLRIPSICPRPFREMVSGEPHRHCWEKSFWTERTRKPYFWGKEIEDYTELSFIKDCLILRMPTLDVHGDILGIVTWKERPQLLIANLFKDLDYLLKDFWLQVLDSLLQDLDSLLQDLQVNFLKFYHSVEKGYPDLVMTLQQKYILESASVSKKCFKIVSTMCISLVQEILLHGSIQLHQYDTISSSLKIDTDKPSKPSITQCGLFQDKILSDDGSKENEMLAAERLVPENDSEWRMDVVKLRFVSNKVFSVNQDVLRAKQISNFIGRGDEAIDTKKVQKETIDTKNGDKTLVKGKKVEESNRGQENFEREMSANMIYKEGSTEHNLNIRKHVEEFFVKAVGKIGTSCSAKLFVVSDLQETGIENDMSEIGLMGVAASIEFEEPVFPRENRRIEIDPLRGEEIQLPYISLQEHFQNDLARSRCISQVVSLLNPGRRALTDPNSFYSVRDFDSTSQSVFKHKPKKVDGSFCEKFWREDSSLPVPRLDIEVYKNEVMQNIAETQKSQGSLQKENSFEPVLEIIKLIADGNDPGPQVTMQYELLRMCTLRNYPKDNKPFLIHFAKAGFYYAAEGDEVICYCCGLRRHSWVATDVPYRIHQRINPNCKFLHRNPEFNVPIVYKGTTENLEKLGKLLKVLEEVRIPPQASTDAESGNDLSEYIPPKTLLPGALNNPKHRQYISKAQRMASYEGWPDNLSQTPEIMAEAGFYYAGFGDCVRCYYCGIGLRHWTAEDNVWIEHARWSKHCAFLKHVKGQEFINLVHMAIQYTQDDEETPVIEPSNPADKELTQKASNGQKLVDQILLTDPAQSVLEMGYTPKMIKKAIAFILNRDGRSGISSQTIMEKVLEFEEAENAKTLAGELANMDLRNQDNSSSGPLSGSSRKSSQRSSVSIATKGSKEDGNAVILCIGASRDLRSKSIKEENEKLKGQTLCRVCTKNTVCIVLLPCGHLCACDECGSALRTCPICQKDVKGTVKTYMS